MIPPPDAIMGDMSIFVVLKQIAPLFLMMAIGIIVGWTRMVDSNFTRTMSAVSMNVLFPASIIKSFYAEVTTAMLREGLSLIIAGGVVLIVTFWLAYGMNRLLGLKVPSSNVTYFSLMFSNFGFVGVGMLTAIYGDKGLFYMTMFVLLLRFGFNSFGTVIMQRNAGDSGRIDWRRALINPPIIALAVAVLVMVTRVRFPPVVETTMNALAGCLSPMGMLTIGMITSTFALRDFFSDPKAYILSGIRLLGIPLVGTILMWLAGMRGLMMTAAALTLALPAPANTSLMAERFGGDVKLGTQVVAITNLFSIVTVPIVVAVAERLAY